MSLRRAALVSLLLLSALPVLGQSADQEVVSAVDSPDPVAPGAILTYTVTLTNHGPDPATGGGININLPGAVTHQNSVAPAGLTCFYLGNNGTCNAPSLAVGTYVFTINVIVNASLASFPDQNISATFFPSGTTVDPNNSNNSKTATTAVDSPQVDVFVSATDSPDPVVPDGNVTYNVTVTNGGPDTASSVNFNVVPNSSLRFQSATVPAGWSCVLPSVGATNATFTCSRATWAPGTDNFIVVFSANDEQFGINDTTFQTNFNVNAGGSNETDNSDNSTTVTTSYVTPDADVTVSVSDSPDPVTPDGNITYTVTVGNSGPDTAPSVTLSAFGSNNLRFQSATVPAGWNCTLPAANAQTAGFSCTLPGGMASGGGSVLTFVLQATDELIGINDTTIQFGFSANSTISDPDPADNTEIESTAYVAPDADLSVTATDSPDPVAPDGDITYTVTVANAGPDSASATLNVPMNNTLKLTSITVPAGFSCTGVPAPGAAASFSCNNPGFASGTSVIFTIVLNADSAAFGNTDQTIVQNFNVTGNVSDPDNTDNSVNVSTQYDATSANLGVTASDAPDPVLPGSNITYTGAVTNAGPDAAASVAFSIPLHPGLLFQSLSGPAGFTCATPAVGANGSITCTIASLANGSDLPFTLVAQVDPALNSGPDGTIQQPFTIGSSASDPTPANNSLTVDTAYTTFDTADLSVTKTTASTSAPAGSTISYTIVLTNNGPDAATNPVLTDVLPASLLFRSITPAAGFTCTTPAFRTTGTITCNGTTLASGASATFTLVVELTQNASGTIVNTASATSDTADGNSGNSSATTQPVAVVAALADLTITKTTASTTVDIGATVTYTITVSNAGPSTATSVAVNDTLPAGLQFISATPSQGTCNNTSPLACNLGTILGGASATITLVTQTTGSASPVINTASATAPEATGPDVATAPAVTVTRSAAVAAIPTLSEWMLILMAALLGIAAVVKTRAA